MNPQEQAAAASSAVDRETEIALGNPLLNLQAALGQSPSAGPASPAPSSRAASTAGGSSSFAVKRRWDDDLIFKNQASGQDLDGKGKKEFVNDLLRTEFHRESTGSGDVGCRARVFKSKGAAQANSWPSLSSRQGKEVSAAGYLGRSVFARCGGPFGGIPFM